jgi:hypothetical protein
MWEHPRREVSLLWKKTVYTYNGDWEAIDAVEGYGHKKFIPQGFRSFLRGVSDGYFWFVLAFGLIGAPLLWSRRDGRSTFLLGAMLAMGLIPLAFFGDVRFHVPASPLFAIAAAAALTWIARRLRGRPAPAPA